MTLPSPFAFLTADLVFLPSPWSADVQNYRTLFRKLHADVAFCQQAFGDHFEPKSWSDEEVREAVILRDARLRWAVRGMGDFALGVLPTGEHGKTAFHPLPGRMLKNTSEEVRVVEGEAFETLSQQFDKVQWVGYTCVRDASTSGGPSTEVHSQEGATNLPSWQEMIEMRYGMDPDFRGRGIATRAAKIMMDWAVAERGTKRFIAETMNANDKSQNLLRRLGFEKSDTKYFGDEFDVCEWVKVVA